MKKLMAIAIMAMMVLSLHGCSCKHVWTEATCTEPKTCTECGEIEGEALGHNMVQESMNERQRELVCTECKKTETISVKDINKESLELLEGTWEAKKKYNGLEDVPVDAPFYFTFTADGSVESGLEVNPGTGSVTYRRYDDWLSMFYFEVEVNGAKYDVTYQTEEDLMFWWHRDRYIAYTCERN